MALLSARARAVASSLVLGSALAAGCELVLPIAVNDGIDASSDGAPLDVQQDTGAVADASDAGDTGDAGNDSTGLGLVSCGDAPCDPNSAEDVCCATGDAAPWRLACTKQNAVDCTGFQMRCSDPSTCTIPPGTCCIITIGNPQSQCRAYEAGRCPGSQVPLCTVSTAASCPAGAPNCVPLPAGYGLPGYFWCQP